MVELALAAYLVLVLPARAIWKSLRQPAPLQTNRAARYARTSGLIAILLLVIGGDWWWSGRPWSGLGFDFPLSARGEIGLVVSILLIVTMLVIAQFSERRLSEEKRAAQRAKLEGNELLPRTAGELRRFLILSLLVGAGWEVLYRGFLLWFLAPHVGTVVSVCVAALAYGLAHGYRSRGQFIGSIVSAFAFTIAFAATHSLWWLMLLHTFFAVYGGLTSYRMFRGSESELAYAKP
ncbi:MAG TPA: CPBP family intramembrane glutamic endopeptidase [Rhodanobacteraceae bacterium]|nr:CPBP family intramembrane glutamic endopeptidase [Rhodanobacteraceae bacterium]